MARLPARSAPADYQGVKAELGIGSKIHALSVSKNRFVVSMNKTAQDLRFLDTWSWRVLNPAGSLNGSAVSMDLNQSGNRLYFAYQDGRIRWMDLGPLFSLGFNENLDSDSIHLEPGTTVPSGSALPPGKIVAIQDSDSASMDCVFVELKDGDTSSLDWLLISGDQVPSGGHLTDSKGTNLELAKSRKRLFVKSEDGSGNSWLYAYRCFSDNSGNKIKSDNLALSPANNSFQGIAADPSGAVLILGNQDQAELWPYEIADGIGGTLIANLGTAYDRLSAMPASQIWLKHISAETDSFVLFKQANTLMLSSLNKDSAEFKAEDPGVIETFSASPLILADSSPKDGYLYVAPEAAELVSLITANPWISNLALTMAGTILTETFKVKFNTDVSHSFYTITNCGRFTISPDNCGDALAQGALDGRTAEVTINSRDLGEGGHILGVFVRDRYGQPYHQGRDALQVKVDLPPPPQEFEMGFGDQRIFINFTSPDVKDLARYLIYYGTNCNAGFYQPEKIDETGGNGDPISPIIIKQPEPDQDYEKVVENLKNGATYCAQIVTVDKAGNKSDSERNSATPEKTKGPSDEAGEKGGLDCLGSVSGRPATSSGSDLILLFLPLTVILLIKIKLRSRR